MVSLRDYIDLRMQEKEKAISRIERAVDARFDQVATQRESFEERAATHATRDWTDARIDGTERELAARLRAVEAVASEYTAFRAASEASVKTMRWVLGTVVALIPIAITLAIVIHDAT